VIGDDHHQRVAVQPGASQPRHELAEQPVRHPELEQVPLV
jgi:hypothetical protein